MCPGSWIVLQGSQYMLNYSGGMEGELSLQSGNVAGI